MNFDVDKKYKTRTECKVTRFGINAVAYGNDAFLEFNGFYNQLSKKKMCIIKLNFII